MLLNRDRLTGLALLLFAAAWIAGVFLTIPDVSDGARLGPRGFPMAMGVMLVILSLFMIGGSFLPADPADADTSEPVDRSEVWAVLVTFGFLGAYMVLLDLFGFLVATLVACAGFLVIPLRKRSPVLIGGIACGLAFGIWLILGKAMGVYLPRGSIIDWF
ncbi:MAG: tripartite tricarboxylate transporter TctB family protein [Xanthobacteraceae bacterium]|uniref:tripartite tricarboxylate transporter TctB family protein n=1 Tax=Pseudolabrys sp. TaxID=1960880 RepID=UPI003D10821C